ncbi:hypothetical protein ACFSTH_12920 [Paenibacillus yanchengensis]|uniref:Uncharacterized protein n=1 Tax=Paenibacillus yanchengensis TaxID=2035833 RepID=A0ABW4YPD0_9BACL
MQSAVSAIAGWEVATSSSDGAASFFVYQNIDSFYGLYPSPLLVPIALR